MTATREEIEFITRFRTEALDAARQAEEALRGLGDGAGDTADGMDDAASNMQIAAEAAASAGAAFATAGASVRVAQQGLEEFGNFEVSMLNVAKVSDLTDTQLEVLGARFEQLAVAAGIPVEQFTEVSAVAGQLGVQGVNDIALFTETVVALGGASNLVGEEGATALARLLNVTGENIESVDTLASVLVELGNSVAATEAEIAHIASAIAQSTSAYDTSSTFASALGAAMAELGLRAELSGTSVGRIFTEIAMAAANGGEAAERFADVMGISLRQFRQVAESDPQQTYMDLLGAMSSMPNSEVLQFLDELGLANAETLRTITPLISNYERLTYVMAMAHEEAANPEALDMEAARARNALMREYAGMVEAARTAIRDLGETWAPVARELTQLATEALMVWNNLPEPLRDVANVLVVVVPAVASLRLAMLALRRVVSLLGLQGIATGLAGVASGAGAAATAMGLLRAAMAAVGGPIGAALGIATALYFALRDIYELDLSGIQEASTQASDALDQYEEASRRAADEQERLSGNVTAATRALLQQSRLAMRESADDLREESEELRDDLIGAPLRRLMVDFDRAVARYHTLMQHPQLGERAGVNASSRDAMAEALGIDLAEQQTGELFDYIQSELHALQSDTPTEDLVGLSSMLDEVRSLGPELFQYLDALEEAANNNDFAQMFAFGDELVNYAENFSFLTDEVDAYREATTQAARGQALLDLSDKLMQAYLASERLGESGESVRNALRELGASERQLALLEARLAGNEELADRLAEELGRASDNADDLADSPEPTFYESANSAAQLAANLGEALENARLLADEAVTDGLSQEVRARIRMNTVGEPVERAGALAVQEYRSELDDGGYGLVTGGYAGELAEEEARVRQAAEAAALLEQEAREADRAWRELQRGDEGAGSGGGGGAGDTGEGLEGSIASLREEIQTRREGLEVAEQEIELMRLSTRERAEARTELELLQAARRENIDVDQELTASGRTYREEIEALAGAVGDLTAQEEERAAALESARERQEFFNQAQETLKEGILDAILEGKNLIDVLSNLAKAFARAALEAALFGSGPFGGGGGGLLGNLFSGLFGGFGGGGATTVNAKGNVVYESAIVPMAKGGRALLGEAGPEAIMPLDRSPDGTLGVRALGAPGAQGGISLNYAPTFNIYQNGQVEREGGADSQTQERLMKMLDDEVRAKVIEVLQREMNSGGLFNPAAKLYG